MKNFDIAFSYASEQSKIVEVYKKKLEELGLSVFIDTDHPELFVFKHVPEVLKKIYDDNETAMLIFLSEDYARKDFTKYEGHLAFDRLLTEKRLAIIRIDDTKLPWLPSSLHFFDIQKYSIDSICLALYVSIKGEYLADMKTLFENMKSYLMRNCKYINIRLNSETCMIFNISSDEKSYIKINYSSEAQSILFFYNSSHIEETSFSVAEIYKNENKFVLYNKGICNSGDLISEFVSENELCCRVSSYLNNFLENLYD